MRNDIKIFENERLKVFIVYKGYIKIIYKDKLNPIETIFLENVHILGSWNLADFQNYNFVFHLKNCKLEFLALDYNFVSIVHV